MRQLTRAKLTSLAVRERLRRKYLPKRVRILFVGEAPPASGRFFYQTDSGLYRAIRDAFVGALPYLSGRDFLAAFQQMGCYLVDLCGQPVDRLKPKARRKVCASGEMRLAKILRRLQPDVVITVVRSIARHVQNAEARATWSGKRVELPYPGRWKSHRDAFTRELVPVLRHYQGK